VRVNCPGLLGSPASASVTAIEITGESSLTIVPVAELETIVALTASVRNSLKVSSASDKLSPLTVMLTVLLVSPGLNVTILFAAV
jgi:hypothetical protein